MSCTLQQQLVSFPKVRVQKEWFRYFYDHKNYYNEGNVHLFSLMSLYSYANFRTNQRRIGGKVYSEYPGQWICRLSSLPRTLRVHSKQKAIELLEYFTESGVLTYEFLNEDKDWLRYEIVGWKRHCTHLNYNYYSYKGSGFFFFPLPVGRSLLRAVKKLGTICFSELDAIVDFWLHTILDDPKVKGSEYMPVVYYADMKGVPLLSYSYLAKRWGWSKSRVGRFILKLEEGGIISRVSFSSSRGSVISPCKYREMIFGADCEQLELQKIGEILGLARVVKPDDLSNEYEIRVETRVPSAESDETPLFGLRIEVFRKETSSFFARPVPFIFYSSRGSSRSKLTPGTYRGPPDKSKIRREVK